MSLAVCRSVILRNSSSPISSTPATNQTKISDVEWITNGISFMMFLLAFIGNTAALIVMFASRGPIRLTNNKYLANLACADLLRSIFIPFTIIARAKRNFIFGRIICKILPIVQGNFSTFPNQYESLRSRRKKNEYRSEEKRSMSSAIKESSSLNL